MLLEAFTLFHVLISLMGIGTGCVVLYQMLSSRQVESWTSWFLWTTIATSVTGFMFPFHKFLPSHALGLLSLAVLGLALYARRSAWAKTFVVSSLVAFYFNVFVLVVQLFEKVPALKELAPTQTEAPFQIAQLVVLLVFLGLGTLATMRVRGTVKIAAAGAGR